MRYRITFKKKVDLGVSITNDITIETRYLLAQLEILTRCGYIIVSARIIEGE